MEKFKNMNSFTKFIIAVVALLLAYVFGVFALAGSLAIAGFAFIFGILGSLFATLLGFLGLTSAAAAVSGFFASIYAIIIAWGSTLLSWVMSGPVWALILKLYTFIQPLMSSISPLVTLGKAARFVWKWFKKRMNKDLSA